MSEKTAESEGSPEYQIGTHDIDRSTSLENSEFVEFGVETAAIFERLANDIYESTEAGVREPLQNAITAVRRAQSEADLDKDDAVIKIKVQDGEQVRLTLRDNGIGISKDVLKEVLAVIGRSQNRDDGEVSGKYGMGFLACYKLVGTDGGFTMYTNSRETDNGPLKGIWKPGGFELDKGGKLPDKLSEDDYGTLFEFTVDEGVDVEDIRDWVEKHSEWARVPILYEEYDSDGELRDDEEYGQKRLTEFHDDNKSVVIDNDYYTAVFSPEACSRTLLINSPISRNSTVSSTVLGWEIDIRLKNENGVVVTGPNEGLQPVGSAEYEDMDESRREEYVREDELVGGTDNTYGDVRLPQPTGTRDTLARNTEFWEYLREKVETRYNERVSAVVEKISDPSSYVELSDDEQRLLDDAIDRHDLIHSTDKKTKDAFESELGAKVSDEFIRLIEATRKRVWCVDRGADATKASRKNSDVAPRVRALEAEHESKSSDVYMAVSLNQAKMQAVWDDDEDNQVVRLKSSDDYDVYEEYFDWKKLKNVTNHLDELDISQEVKEKLTGEKKGTKADPNKRKNSQRPPEERHLTVHQEGIGQSGFTAEDLKEQFDGGDEYLILFPSNCDENLSDHWHLESTHTAIANCIVKVYDYLKEAQNVYSIDDWYDHVDGLSVETNKGSMKIQELKKEDEVLFHVVDDSMVDVFRDDAVMTEMQTVVFDSNNHNSSYSAKLDKYQSDEVTYVPVTASELDTYRVAFGENPKENAMTLTADVRTSMGLGCNPVSSDVYWYAWARLPRWRNTKEIASFDKDRWTLTPDWVWLIDKLASSEYEVKSISGLDVKPPEEVLEFQTNNGKMSLREMMENYEVITLHVLPLDTVDAFRSDAVTDDALEYIMKNARPEGVHSSEVISEDDDIDDYVYVPVTNSEHENIVNVAESIDDTRFTISDTRKSANIATVTGEFSGRFRETPKHEIRSDTAAYAYARLDREVSDVAVPLDEHDVLTNLSDGGLELIETLRSGQNSMEI